MQPLCNACEVPDGVPKPARLFVSTVLCFNSPPNGVPNPIGQSFCLFCVSLGYLMDRPIPQGSCINSFVSACKG